MNEDEPLVSIIVPAYNHEKFVGECIESIINQKYINIELIILNDGSKDNTAEVIRKYEQICNNRFKRFIFIDKANEGICKTLNRGIKVSKGEYFCFIASDDSMSDNCVQYLVDYFIKNEDVERIISNFYIYYYDIKKKELCYKEKPKWESYMNSDRDKFLVENILQNQITVFGMYSKSVIDKVGLFDENLLIEDWDMNLRILYNNIKLGYLSEPLFFYRKHSDSVSFGIGNYRIMLDGCLQILKKIEKDKNIVFSNKKSIINRARGNKYLETAIKLEKFDDKKYKKYVKEAIKEYPFNIIIYKLLIKRAIKDILGPKLVKNLKAK